MVWSVKKLGDVCDIVGGGTPSKSNDSFYEGDIPWATVRDMRNDRLSRTEISITEEAIKNSSTNLIPSGTIITATRVGLGKVCVLEQDTAINQDLKAIIPKTEELDSTFLYWWLKSIAHVIVGAGTGATVQGVKLTFVKALEIPLPPIPEQKRIVALLDTVFADLEQARTKTEQNLKNASELFDSYLQQVFSQKGEGWVESKLGDLLHISSSKRVYAKDWTDSGVPFFGGKEIVKLAKYGKAASNAFISEEKYMDYASKYDMPQAGDILMTARGTIGVGYIVKEGDKFYYKDGNIISLRQKKPTNPDFILYAFKSHKIIDQIKELTGTTVSHLPLNKAKEIFINIPSYQVQNELVVQIKEVESNIQQVASIYEEKLTSLDELKKSILQKAFSGELTHK
ncbi:MAG: restriction endonuclease subunit S [Vibrio toranzoniae]